MPVNTNKVELEESTEHITAIIQQAVETVTRTRSVTALEILRISLDVKDHITEMNQVRRQWYRDSNDKQLMNNLQLKVRDAV